MSKITVIGSGSWGTALAQVLCDNGENVIIYGRESQEVNLINQHKSKFFPNVEINHNLKASNDFEDSIIDSDIILLAVPTSSIESVCLNLAKIIKNKPIIINTAKGFHPTTYERMSVVIKNIFQDKILGLVSLIGPSHAEEVIIRQLTSICAVSTNLEIAKKIQGLFSNNYLRIYTLDDEIGAEYGVALKNVMALASGIITGLGYGDNTKAALMTRGLAEMSRFGVKMGGKIETFLGLTGLGDLIVTCTSVHSRNFQAGYVIGKSNNAEKFLKTNIKTVEGINSCKATYFLAKKLNIDMPITNGVYDVVFNGRDCDEVISDLMNRKLISEY